MDWWYLINFNMIRHHNHHIPVHASGTHGLPENQPAIVDVHGQLGDFPTKGISNIPLYSHYTTIVTPLCVW